MKQISLAIFGFELVTKRTCKREFFDEMNQVIPWSQKLLGSQKDRIVVFATQGRQIAMMQDKHKALDITQASHILRDKLKKLKGSTRVKLEHPLRLIKFQFRYRKPHYRWARTPQLLMMFALSNFWMVRKQN